MIAGARVESGLTKLWLNRRTRDGLDAWEKTCTVNSAAVKSARMPLLRFADGSYAMAAAATSNNGTKLLLARLDPWGASSCAESGLCASKSEADCDDGKAHTIDLCTPEKIGNKPVGCQAKTLPCLPRQACEVTAIDVKHGCLYAADKCDDNNACTKDSCDPKKGTPTGGGCVHVKLDPEVACDDGKPCTLNTCDKATGCANPNAAKGTSCPTDDCHSGKCDTGQCVQTLLETKQGCSSKSPGLSCNHRRRDVPGQPAQRLAQLVARVEKPQGGDRHQHQQVHRLGRRPPTAVRHAPVQSVDVHAGGVRRGAGVPRGRVDRLPVLAAAAEVQELPGANLGQVAKRGTSLNQLVREYLQELTREARAKRALQRWKELPLGDSGGDIGERDDAYSGRV